MYLRNTTRLDTGTLQRLLLRHTSPWRHDGLRVFVRYGRGADFSGRCYYREGRILVNLGRQNRYPYRLATYVAKAQSYRTHWTREIYYLVLPDAFALVLFVYLHELYHHLVYAAGRCPRQKEAMCDRFATRVLVEQVGCPLVDGRGAPAPRSNWDIRDLDAFVSGAPREAPAARPAAARKPPRASGTQGWLFAE